MKLISELKEIREPFKKAVVTIGNFDGVHIGHQALIRLAIEKARRLKGTSVVMTFEPHPLRVLNYDKRFPLITPYEQKVELIRTTGVDVLVCMPFTRELAAMPAKTFVKRVLCETIGMKAVIAGPDYSFGKNREGDISLLKEMARTCGFEVVIPGWVKLGAQRVSSTEIRNLVSEGGVNEAAKLLGRHYQVRGIVVHGRHRGGGLMGFPATKLRLDDELCPSEGLYAVTVEYNGSTYNGIANIRGNPTFDHWASSVEIHMLNFEQAVHGGPLRVNFVRRLRSKEQFQKAEALISQIGEEPIGDPGYPV